MSVHIVSLLLASCGHICDLGDSMRMPVTVTELVVATGTETSTPRTRLVCRACGGLSREQQPALDAWESEGGRVAG